MPSDLRTTAIILRRTNYGETDRILSLLTPEGKISALAKGVRKEKSKLAGGIELFSVSDVVLHQKTPSASGFAPGYSSASAGYANSSASYSGRTTSYSGFAAGRSNLAILTSAKMLRFYSNILQSLPRLELAAACLKKLDRAAEQTDSPEYFTILQQVLAELDRGTNLNLVAAWFYLNLARASGEEINLIRDVAGAPLSPAAAYFWDGTELAFRPDPHGTIQADAIKFARLLVTQPLATARCVTGAEQLTPLLEPLWRCYTA